MIPERPLCIRASLSSCVTAESSQDIQAIKDLLQSDPSAAAAMVAAGQHFTIAALGSDACPQTAHAALHVLCTLAAAPGSCLYKHLSFLLPGLTKVLSTACATSNSDVLTLGMSCCAYMLLAPRTDEAKDTVVAAAVEGKMVHTTAKVLLAACGAISLHTERICCAKVCLHLCLATRQAHGGCRVGRASGHARRGGAHGRG